MVNKNINSYLIYFFIVCMINKKVRRQIVILDSSWIDVVYIDPSYEKKQLEMREHS